MHMGRPAEGPEAETAPADVLVAGRSGALAGVHRDGPSGPMATGAAAKAQAPFVFHQGRSNSTWMVSGSVVMPRAFVSWRSPVPYALLLALADQAGHHRERELAAGPGVPPLPLAAM